MNRAARAKVLVSTLGQTEPRAGDMALVISALADDATPSKFSFLARKGLSLSAGMTTAHLGDYIAQNRAAPAARRADREYVRDYVVKLLLATGVVEMAVADGKTGQVIVGRHDPKSANNCYVLTTEAKGLLDAADFVPALKRWVDGREERRVLAEEKRLRAQAAGLAASSHAQMIEATIQMLVEGGGPLSGYEVVYKDLGDDTRIPAAMQARVDALGIPLDLQSKWPDIILYEPRANAFRLIEVVKSDGEMSTERVGELKRSWEERGLRILGFTTVYADWRSAAARQEKVRNLAPGSELFILSDPVRIFTTGLMSSIK